MVEESERAMNKVHAPIKIQKPMVSLKTTSQEDLINIIRKQGKTLGMGKWEINALIETFRKKNAIRKAYHILLEYSTLHNDIFKLLLKRLSYMKKLLSCLRSDKILLQEDNIGHIVAKLAEYSLKSWIAICRWRQLQWSPRPILLSSDLFVLNRDLKDSIEERAEYQSTKEPNSFMTIFENDAAEIIKLTASRSMHLIDMGVRPIHLVVVFATSAANALSDRAIANAMLRAPELNNNDIISDDKMRNASKVLLSPYEDLISSLRELSRVEISMGNVWEMFASFRGTNQKQQSQNIPVLKLNYGNSTAQHLENDSSALYAKACDILLGFLVRHFSVVVPTKNQSSDLHVSVLKSMAQINGTVTHSISRSTSPVMGANSNYCNNNDKACEESNPLESLPLRKNRPVSSPLIRSPVSADPVAKRSGDERIVSESSPVFDPDPVFDTEVVSPANEHHRTISYLQPGPPSDQKNEIIFQEDAPEVEVKSPQKDYVGDFNEVSLNDKYDQESREIDIQNQTLPTDNFAARCTESKKNDLENRLDESILPIHSPLAPSKEKETIEPPPTSRYSTDVQLELDNVQLELERVDIQHGRDSTSRLLVRDYKSYCASATVSAVDIGDELLSLGGVSVEGEPAEAVSWACRKLNAEMSKASVRDSPPRILAAVFRKQYAGRDEAMETLKKSDMLARQRWLKQLPRHDLSALEATLQVIRAEVDYWESCIDEVGQQGFNNVRRKIVSKFGELKAVQDLLSSALVASSDAQKIAFEQMKSQMALVNAQEVGKMESPPVKSKREAVPKDAVRTASPATETRKRSNTMEIEEEENLDALTWSKKRTKKKNRRHLRNSREGDYFVPSQYHHVQSKSNPSLNRPLLSNLHFERHWCAEYSDGYSDQVTPVEGAGSLSNAAQYAKVKAGVVSNTVKVALRRVEVKGKGASKEVVAARKLCAWWQLTYPQKVLNVRMHTRNMVLDIVHSVVDKSISLGEISIKRRLKMMRNGASIVIQRVFRGWKKSVLLHVLSIQKYCKRYLVRKKVLRLVNVVRAAVLVARFLYKRKIRLRKIVGKRVHYKRVIRHFMEHYGYLHRDTNQKEMMQLMTLRGRNYSSSFIDTKEGYAAKRRLEACIKIQSFFRMIAAQWYYKYLAQEDYICKKVRCAMKILQLRRKILNKRKLRAAAVKMQRMWRGCSSRWRLYLQVIAGIKITAAWRKYRQYWKLKQCLRRIEFPVEIVLHGIRNIASQLIYSKKIKVRVSVWWNSLLHLVDNKDFMTITQSKQPHIIRTTALYDCENMPELVSPALLAPIIKKPLSSQPQAQAQAQTPALAAPPPTEPKPRGGKRLSLMAQAQKINVGVSDSNENSLSAFVARQAQKKNNLSLKMAVKKSMLTKFAIQPIAAGDSDDESESSSDSSSSSSCSDDSSAENDDDIFDPGNSFNKSALGSNLLSNKSKSVLPPLATPFPTTSASTSGSNTGAGPLENSALLPRRTTMTRVSRTEVKSDTNSDSSKKKSSFGGMVTASNTANLINKSFFGFSNAFKQSQQKKKEDEDKSSSKPPTAYQCNLNEETLYIPGCHGNAVIRFDLYDGDRKFGTNLFQLSEDSRLLFWGGEYNREVSVTKIRRAVQLGANTIKETERSRLVQQEQNPVLDVRVVSGAALRSKCGWALVSIRGTGPVKRRLRAKGGFSKIFDDWDRGYLSMDGENIYCYKSKNAPFPWITISLSDIKSIHIELNTMAKGGESSKKKSAPAEDKFDVVITSSTRDVFHLKFPGASARESWVRVIVDAVDYSRESLKTRLNFKSFSPKNDKHMS